MACEGDMEWAATVLGTSWAQAALGSILFGKF